MFQLMVIATYLVAFLVATTLAVVVLCLRAPLRNDFADDGMGSFDPCQQAAKSSAVLTAMKSRQPGTAARCHVGRHRIIRTSTKVSETH